MISTLQELIAPLTRAEFTALLRARVLTFRRGSGENRFAGLLDSDSLRRTIDSNAIPAALLSVTKNRRRVPPHFYQDQGTINANKLASELNRGASLIAHALDPYVRSLDALCSEIRAHIAEKIFVDAILTSGAGGALKVHFDPEDNIILQMEGSKRWRIYGSPMVNPVQMPLAGTLPSGAPVFDEVLRPGDFLFLPGGYWHECENGPGQSLHLGIGFNPPSGWLAMQAFLRRLLHDALFRAPLTRFGGPAEAAAHEVALKARLVDTLRQVSLSELLADDSSDQTVTNRYDK